MGGSSSALSMGYAVGILIVLYLFVTAIFVLVGYLKNKIKKSRMNKSKDD